MEGRQLLKIAGEDLAGFDQLTDSFGQAVATDNGLAVVSTFLGSAFVVDLKDGGLVSQLDTDGRQSFGGLADRRVAIEGQIALVGERTNDRNRGAVFVYDVASGSELSKLIPVEPVDVGGSSDPYFGDCVSEEHDCSRMPVTAAVQFGFSVDVDSGVAVVGAPGEGVGAAYLFDVESGTQIAKLSPSDGANNDYFGWSVAIDNGLAVVGSPYSRVADRRLGAAYVFDVATGQEVRKLYPTDIESVIEFGVSVDLNESIAIVGSPTDDEFGHGSGAAYLFDVQTGESLARLVADDPGEGDNFGWSVAIDADTVLIGAHAAGVHPEDPGAAYVFDLESATQTERLAAPDGGSSASLGTSVALDGGLAVVSALLASDSDEIPNGAVYVFDLSVPEPTTAVLAVIAGVAAAAGLRRGLPGGAAGTSAAVAGSAARG